MGLSNAEKQAAWRARQAANKARVAELEAEVARLKVEIARLTASASPAAVAAVTNQPKEEVTNQPQLVYARHVERPDPKPVRVVARMVTSQPDQEAVKAA